VGELETTMTRRELMDWRRFELQAPLPDRLIDIHFGMVCSIMVNLMRSADTTAAQPSDFFVLREREPQPDDGMSEIDRLRLQWRGG
jgi:hypothetical protein